MNINEAFPTKYLSAADLSGRDVHVTIQEVSLELMPDGEHKMLVTFVGKQKGFLLNKTNANSIADLHGHETDGWSGKAITLYPDRVAFQGKMVPCIRVREQVPAQGGGTAVAPAAPTAPPAPVHQPISEDDIPF